MSGLENSYSHDEISASSYTSVFLECGFDDVSARSQWDQNYEPANIIPSMFQQKLIGS